MSESVLHCNHCRKRYGLRRSAGGLKVRCPQCGELLEAERDRAAKRRDPYLKKALAGCRTTARVSAGRLSITYRAVHHKYRMPVVLEVFSHDRPGYDEERALRLLRGLAAAADLRHPNVATLLDMGRREGYDYVVRELVDGGTARALIEQHSRVALTTLLPIVEDVLGALCAAEERGLRHAGISPDAILLDYDGRAKLGQFGRPLFEDELGEFTLSPGGTVTGSAFYVAPEQLADQEAGDIRSDLYALGCTLYEMLSGHVPFDGESAVEILAARVEAEPPPLSASVPELAGEVSGFVRRLMGRRPDDRPSGPAEAIEELKGVALGVSGRREMRSAPRMAASGQGERARGVQPLLWTALAVALVVLAMIPLWRLRAGRDRDRRGRGSAEEARQARLRGGTLIVVQPADAEPLPQELRSAVLALAAVHLAALGPLAPVDPFRGEELLARGGLDHALLASDAAFLLLITHSPGLGRLKWDLSLTALGDKGWNLRAEATTAADASDAAAIGEALQEIVGGAALRVGVTVQGLPPGAGDAALMETATLILLAKAWRLERAGRLAEARVVLQEAPAAGPLAALLAFYEAADCWERGGQISVEARPQGDALPGEFALLADAVAALGTGDAALVNAVVARYLAACPHSARGHYVLGMWRAASGSPPDEAMAALWRALEADPGYMPAARAAARLACAQSPERLDALLRRYRSLAEDEQKARALEAYCTQLAGER